MSGACQSLDREIEISHLGNPFQNGDTFAKIQQVCHVFQKSVLGRLEASKWGLELITYGLSNVADIQHQGPGGSLLLNDWARKEGERAGGREEGRD